MMIYLLDTNAVTALGDNNQAARQNLEQIQPEDEVYTCFVVLAEWDLGVLLAKNVVRQREILVKGTRIFNILTGILHSTHEVCSSYSAIAAELRKAGTQIPANDMWIAAVARSIGATIVTSDKHFTKVQGLLVVDWTQ